MLDNPRIICEKEAKKICLGTCHIHFFPPLTVEEWVLQIKMV